MNRKLQIWTEVGALAVLALAPLFQYAWVLILLTVQVALGFGVVITFYLNDMFAMKALYIQELSQEAEEKFHLTLGWVALVTFIPIFVYWSFIDPQILWFKTLLAIQLVSYIIMLVVKYRNYV